MIEEKVSKPLHWFVCQLHANELPLRHLITRLDGKTTGPRGFVGTIGKQLEKCETLDLVDFESVPTNLQIGIVLGQTRNTFLVFIRRYHKANVHLRLLLEVLEKYHKPDG